MANCYPAAFPLLASLNSGHLEMENAGRASSSGSVSSVTNEIKFRPPFTSQPAADVTKGLRPICSTPTNYVRED